MPTHNLGQDAWDTGTDRDANLTTEAVPLSPENGPLYLSEPSLSGVCEMPRLLEKSVLLEETLAKPFPPVTMDYESIKGKLGQR